MDVTPIRILATEEMKVTCDNNPVSLNCCSEINVNWSTVEWKQQGKINIPGKDVRCPCAYTFLPLGQVKMGEAPGGRGNVRRLFFPKLHTVKKY